ncbi:hypothetical protein K443DRAFT_55748, partial [Laccaria amethystina LaAM-08-1]
NANWTPADKTAFFEFLHEHKALEVDAAAGNGNNFKVTTYEAAAAVLEAKRTKGGPKTAKSCSNKWNSVCDLGITPDFFCAIQAIKNDSGWTWSDECRADITPELEDEWATFFVANKHAKPFKNCGWIHLEKMVDIMP